MRFAKAALIVLAVLLVFAAAAGFALYGYARRSLPAVNGTEVVAGLTAAVEIVRDADAIPHVFAANKQDALFGLGYVHAQDRLWQMEFQRRVGHGRLSEIFGRATIPQDRFLRTVGFGRAARTAWNATPEWAKQQINAYVAGVNAFIASHRRSALPPEFTLLRFQPEPWTGPDVLVWVKMMAWDLSANYTFELLRDDLVRAVGVERMAQLMPPYPVNGLSIVESRSAGESSGAGGSGGASASGGSSGSSGSSGVGGAGGPNGSSRWSRSTGTSGGGGLNGAGGLSGTREAATYAFHAPNPTHLTYSHPPYQPYPTHSTYSTYPPHPTYPTYSTFTKALSAGLPEVSDLLLGSSRAEALGSNNWVVDGTLTTTGKPLLANDPHLGTRIPSTWYLAHLVGGDFEVIGATLPGTPAVALGRNRFIAWGATNVAADVEDLYRERLDPSGRFAEFRGSQEPITSLPETITVKGTEPLQLTVRITRHGPLVSDAINATNAESKRTPKPPPLDPLAFRWTALDPADSTVMSFLKVNEAHNWEQFTAALRDYVAPAQNFVYADVDGHIGYYAPGHIPVRASGDGARPTNGWTGETEWVGWIPYDRLPHLLDPPEHFIVTANHRPASPDYPYHLGLEWPEPYRAQRVLDLIQERTIFGPAEFARMQADTYSLHARALVPLLLRYAQPARAEDQQAVSMLREWSFDAARGSAAAAIFQAWFYQLAPVLAGDDLGLIGFDGYQSRFTYITRFVVNTLNRNDAQWCDDRSTPETETCQTAVTDALHRAVADLTGRMGRNLASWRWDRVHLAAFPHSGLDTVSALRPLLSRSVPNGGDWSTVNVGPVAADTPYEQHSVPGYREIIDLSPANDSRFLDAVGQSGHPLSSHYDDFLSDWQAVKHRKMRMERGDIETGAVGRLRLVPE